MVAAAGAGMAAVEHELLGAEPALARLLVERGDVVDQFRPARRRMDVDLDDAGIGRHAEHPQARIARRPVTFQPDPQAGRGGAGLDVAISHNASSIRVSGGRKTCSSPSRTCTQRAVWTTSRGEVSASPFRRAAVPLRLSWPVPPARPRGSRGAAAATRAATTAMSATPIAGGASSERFVSNGSGPKSGSMSSGSRQGSDSSGRRKPSGESPGTRNSLPLRSGHLLERQRGVPAESRRIDRHRHRPSAAARSRPARRDPAAPAAASCRRCRGSFRS